MIRQAFTEHIMIVYRTFVELLPKEDADIVKQVLKKSIITFQLRSEDTAEENLKFTSPIEVADKKFLEITPIAPTFHFVLRSDVLRINVTQHRELIALTLNLDDTSVYEAVRISRGNQVKLSPEEVETFLNKAKGSHLNL